MTVIFYIWFVAWAGTLNDVPWWWTALAVTQGYALFRLINDVVLSKKEKARD